MALTLCLPVGVNPINGVEKCLCTAEACILHVNAFNICVPSEKLHQLSFHAFTLIDQRFRTYGKEAHRAYIDLEEICKESSSITLNKWS